MSGGQQALIGLGGYFYPPITLNMAGPGTQNLFSMFPDGTWNATKQGAQFTSGNWVLPGDAGQGGRHWVKATLIAGSVSTPGGTSPVGSWFSLSGGAVWARYPTGAVTLQIDISMNASGSPIVASSTISMSA